MEKAAKPGKLALPGRGTQYAESEFAHVYAKATREHTALLIAPIKADERVRVKVEEYAEEYRDQAEELWPFAREISDVFVSYLPGPGNSLSSSTGCSCGTWSCVQTVSTLHRTRVIRMLQS